VQVLPIDSSVASFTFLPVAGCGVPAVLAGEALPCDEPAPPLPVGEHLVPVTVCLPAAPFQPTVCATADTTILVARTLAQGAIVDDGAGVEGARVDLLLVSGEQTPLVRRALTGVGGAYAFVDPPLGRYRVVVSTEEDGVWTERATFELEIAAEGRTDVESVDLAP
jgi:hypothetical protein